MVEVKVDIRFLPDGAHCDVETSGSGDHGRQAALVAFAHYAAQVISMLGRARSSSVVQVLSGSEPPGTEPTEGRVRVLTRFVDGGAGPRLDFRVRRKAHDDAPYSVRALRDTLSTRAGGDAAFRRTLELTAELVGRLGAAGQIRAPNEFDIALAAVDVAWRAARPVVAEGAPEGFNCPACGNSDARAGFDLRLWPSDAAALRKCKRCGAGVWQRRDRRLRLLRADIWSTMESLRAELGRAVHGDAGADGGGFPLLDELKRIFDESGWPYSEVRGAPVLLTNLSGPSGSWSFYAQAVEDRNLILLYSVCPERVPEDRRRDVAEFLTRANYGLAAGNFELDFDDGEVRYKTAWHVEGEPLDGLTLRRLVRANGLAVEVYLPRIESVIGGSSGRSEPV